MQIVIEIPEAEYIATKLLVQRHNIGSANDRVIASGTPLPEHHGRLLILDERIVERNLVSLNTPTSFCNKWLSEVGISNSVVKIIPATKEGD